MIASIMILGDFTSLNDYIGAERSNRFQAAKIKKMETNRVALSCAGLSPIPSDAYPLMVHFDWYTSDARTDADNVDFARKFILDGLVSAGILENDSRRFIAGGSYLCHVDAHNPRVVVSFEKA